MAFELASDPQRCNFCVYWTGQRKKDDEFIFVDFDNAEWGICLRTESILFGKPMASCEGCSRCEDIRTLSKTR